MAVTESTQTWRKAERFRGRDKGHTTSKEMKTMSVSLEASSCSRGDLHRTFGTKSPANHYLGSTSSYQK